MMQSMEEKYSLLKLSQQLALSFSELLGYLFLKLLLLIGGKGSAAVFRDVCLIHNG